MSMRACFLVSSEHCVLRVLALLRRSALVQQTAPDQWSIRTTIDPAQLAAPGFIDAISGSLEHAIREAGRR